MTITFNPTKAREILFKIFAMMEDKTFPFDQPDLFPDAVVPEQVKAGDIEHARYLFHAISLDRNRPSPRVYSAMKNILSKLETLNNLHKIPESKLIGLLETHLEKNPTKTPGNPVQSLRDNSQKLELEYNSDPRKLKRKTIEQTAKQIQEFINYGPRSNTLLIKNYTRFGIWDFPHHEICIKPDRHAIRIAFSTGILETNQENPRAEAAAKILMNGYQKLCSEEGYSAVQLNDGLWAIGSILCNKNNQHDCSMNCAINCKTRSASDKTATWYQPNQESRNMNGKSLFPFESKKEYHP
ncbi:MAG: hypothetical protein WC438_02640 [Candidatus Pacearchaeota archaeon]